MFRRLVLASAVLVAFSVTGQQPTPPTPTAAADANSSNESRSVMLESVVWHAIANSGVAVTSIRSVKCSAVECEIRLTGVNNWQALDNALFMAGWDRTRPGTWPLFKQGGIGHDQTEPGVSVWTVSTRCPARDLYTGPTCPE